MISRSLIACLALAAVPALAQGGFGSHGGQTTGPTLAQGGHNSHGGYTAAPAAAPQAGHAGHSAAPANPADNPATRAYRDANAKMHRDMDIAYSNDPDADFIRGMIPHHQGAIDMAKVVLQHGKDEQTRKWAADIIREQEREIAEMREWLKKRGL